MKASPLIFLLDANACNARQAISELNELEALTKVGRVELMYTETTWQEAQAGSLLRKRKVDLHFFTGLNRDSRDFSSEDHWRKTISDAVFPNGIDAPSKRQDVEALLTAKIAGAPFVTRDGASNSQTGGILGNKERLAALGVEVLSFGEALARARDA